MGELSLELGYRNFFASVLARNQRGFARGVKASGVPRDQLFICGTVLSDQAGGFDAAYKATKEGCDENLEAFKVGGIDYVDMIMLDYPGPVEGLRGDAGRQADEELGRQQLQLRAARLSTRRQDCHSPDGEPAALLYQLLRQNGFGGEPQ